MWIVAENGLYHRLGGRGAEWGCMLQEFDDSWIGSIKPVFKYFEERTPGTVTETQEGSITWHYREADEDFGEIQASDLQMHLERVLSNQPVEIALDAKQVQHHGQCAILGGGGHSWPPSAPPTAFEGLGPPSSLATRGSVPQISPRGHGIGARPRQSHRYRRV